ncbi:MAG: hypothetical protein Q8O85_16605 [Rhodoferax sp.]|uniref:hypothetical protein n=1 Tax=Rhodoferax sp. TaxID=50421 RepID=UPI0008C5FCEF|nr:hypothetical protein [Rhodoferax sp.]MDP2680323.1 hypothetical protein [Rhodoferax sp.]OGB58093.1 MAG: hypothetical protein A2503_07475 [Burkholderiales bacterium RIFOXYD12_FULL_59_19]OGB82331.1 MAG: hypothetical protein A2496_10000 [Burkholderiales bacterium RIFOXYC12_FULL_60_6]OGB83904.1 MAG: hypothetical protein A2535_05230 [Burkholderiales bacterium RIFOXYD2_FULL_59_8]
MVIEINLSQTHRLITFFANFTQSLNANREFFALHGPILADLLAPLAAQCVADVGLIRASGVNEFVHWIMVTLCLSANQTVQGIKQTQS